MKKKLKVLILSDLSCDPGEQDFSKDIDDPGWYTEKHVLETLTKDLGHQARLICIYNSIDPLLNAVKEDRPDIIFNLAEQFNDNTTMERNIAGLMELLGVPYTGNGPTSLMLCKNKATAKSLLRAHRINTPRYMVISKNQKINRPNYVKFPLFVKPLRAEASVGLSQSSYVATDEELKERVEFIHKKIGQAALVEEYIHGRELYIGILGNRRLQVFPTRELKFGNMPENKPRFATFKMKWDEEYRDKWKITNGFAENLDPKLQEQINRTCKRAYKLLQMKGYGRIDVRLTEENKIYILEANPNPHLAEWEDYAESAHKANVDYPELIQRIITLGLRASRGQ